MLNIYQLCLPNFQLQMLFPLSRTRSHLWMSQHCVFRVLFQDISEWKNISLLLEIVPVHRLFLWLLHFSHVEASEGLYLLQLWIKIIYLFSTKNQSTVTRKMGDDVIDEGEARGPFGSFTTILQVFYFILKSTFQPCDWFTSCVNYVMLCVVA